jgi:PAS domain-containing protein
MTVDIDEVKKAEERLRSAAQLQATLTAASHSKCDSGLYWCAAPSGGLTFVNKRTADYLGLPKDHPLRFRIDIGASWDAHIPLLHPDDREESRIYVSRGVLVLGRTAGLKPGAT